MKPITPKSMHALALNLIDLLDGKELYEDAIIYVGTGTKIQKYPAKSLPSDPDLRPVATPKGLTVYESDFKGPLPTEYNNPETLTVTFEDDLYVVINQFGKLHEELNALFAPYGLYLEMGHAWNFSIYPIN